MIAMSRSGFAHRAHPRARRRQLFDQRCAGRAGPPWTKPAQPSLLTQAVKARHEYVASQITSRGWPHVIE